MKEKFRYVKTQTVLIMNCWTQLQSSDEISFIFREVFDKNSSRTKRPVVCFGCVVESAMEPPLGMLDSRATTSDRM